MKTRVYFGVGVVVSFLSSSYMVAPLRSQENANATAAATSSSAAKDPGVRAGSVNAGTPLSGLTASQLQYFQDGLTRFQEIDQVVNGLGPRSTPTVAAAAMRSLPQAALAPPPPNTRTLARIRRSRLPQPAAPPTVFRRLSLPMDLCEKRGSRSPWAPTEHSHALRTVESTLCLPSPAEPTRPAVLWLNRTFKEWRS